jgi:very-short-patch-repair endonuclease
LKHHTAQQGRTLRNHHGVELTENPFNKEGTGFVYKQGSESDAGEYKPPGLSGVCALIVERARAAMQANPTSDSPIESILGAAIILCFEKSGKPLKLASEPSDKAEGLQLIPQFKWAIYRSDWAIYNPKTTGALLIECDGKEYHSTPNQIAHDTRKDQAAHDCGFLTMRFTGSQIHRSADDCAKEIFGFVHGGARG